jgi:hypothetical protein
MLQAHSVTQESYAGVASHAVQTVRSIREGVRTPTALSYPRAAHVRVVPDPDPYILEVTPRAEVAKASQDPRYRVRADVIPCDATSTVES